MVPVSSYIFNKILYKSMDVVKVRVRRRERVHLFIKGLFRENLYSQSRQRLIRKDGLLT
jgi:hypothetical protein